MKKILIINLDRNFRSVYSASLAASLLKKYPFFKITLIASDGTETLESTNLFEKIHFMDVETFFEESKEISSEDSEKNILQFLAPMIDTEWYIVLNLSSNPLGSILAYFLKSKRVVGPHFKEDFSEMKYSDFYSYMLLNIPDDYKNFFHFSFIYQAMLNQFEKVGVATVWEKKEENSLDKMFSNLKKQSGKLEIVLIDTGLQKTTDHAGTSFIFDLFMKLAKESKFLPILLSNEANEDSFIISRLRESLPGEIHVLNSNSKADLYIVGKVPLLVTNDLYLKSIADLTLTKSILLSQDTSLPLGDFSALDGSCLVNFKKYDSRVVTVVSELCQKLLSDPSLELSHSETIPAYQTFIREKLPMLKPISHGGNDEFASWWLGLKFLARSQKLDIPFITMNPIIVNKVIQNERRNISESRNKAPDSLEGILGIGVQSMKYKDSLDSKKAAGQVELIIKDLTEFLTIEEAHSIP